MWVTSGIDCFFCLTQGDQGRVRKVRDSVFGIRRHDKSVLGCSRLHGIAWHQSSFIRQKEQEPHPLRSAQQVHGPVRRLSHRFQRVRRSVVFLMVSR